MGSRKYAPNKIYLLVQSKSSLQEPQVAKFIFSTQYRIILLTLHFLYRLKMLFLVRRVSYMAECREICLEFSLHAMLLAVSVE